MTGNIGLKERDWDVTTNYEATNYKAKQIIKVVHVGRFSVNFSGRIKLLHNSQ